MQSINARHLKRSVFPLRTAICAVIKSLLPRCITKTWGSIVDTDAQSFCIECQHHYQELLRRAGVIGQLLLGKGYLLTKPSKSLNQ